MKKSRLVVAAVAALARVFTSTPAQAYGGAAPAGTIVDVAVTASGGGTPDGNPWDYGVERPAARAMGDQHPGDERRDPHDRPRPHSRVLAADGLRGAEPHPMMTDAAAGAAAAASVSVLRV
ncbi:hypothetical protein [Microbacterium sp. LWS13-1.2]|uniref:Uncharacterized protein n=1 Tax=Microbacterium sp. LWS13-1.2 TaxID=3135264 RepID=A0AAU6SFN7_9MICO